MDSDNDHYSHHSHSDDDDYEAGGSGGRSAEEKEFYIDARPLHDEQLLLQQLPLATTALFSHPDWQKKPLCHPGTHADVIDTIMAWARCGSPDASVGKRVFWLNGIAGTGKSTIARTIARRCHDEGRLGASFTFSRSSGGDGDCGERRTARRLVSSIAVQLAQRSTALRHLICRAVRDQSSSNVGSGNRRHMVSLSDEWRQLVHRPCKMLAALMPEALEPPPVVVIDALDECSDESVLEFLLQLMSESLPDGGGFDVPLQLRIIVTSRPEVLDRHRFSALQGDRWGLQTLHHRVDPVPADCDDIPRFILSAFKSVKQVYSFSDAWPGAEALNALVAYSNGLFISAATACRFIHGGGMLAPQRLRHLLQRGEPRATDGPRHSLDMIYLDVLQNAVNDRASAQEQNSVCDLIRNVIGTITLLLSPLSLSSLVLLMGFPEPDVRAVLSDLHSIIYVPNASDRPIRPQHATVGDFILDEYRCTDSRLRVDKRKAHAHIAIRCLQLIASALKHDICELIDPGALTIGVPPAVVASRFPPALRYACRHWVHHVQQSENPRELESAVTMFIRQHFLCWLEAMSLLRVVDEAVEVTALLERLYDNEQFMLKPLAADAKRFVLYCRDMVAEAPLQAYVSAVLFAPRDSIIRQLFAAQLPPWIGRRSATTSSWSQELMTFNGHTNDIRAVAFSSDNLMLASAASNKTVRLWDTRCGKCLGVLSGHRGKVRDVAFSPNGQLLASGSDHGEAFVWSAKTGALLHSLDGRAVAFSPDGTLFAAAYSTGNLRLWSATTFKELRTIRDGWDDVGVLNFSPDGQLLAAATKRRQEPRCGSGTPRIAVWHTSSGMRAAAFSRPHARSVRAMAFAADGLLVAVAFAPEQHVELWNATANRCLGSFRHTKAAAFSQDSRLLALLSVDDALMVWHFRTGTLRASVERRPGESHQSLLVTFALSPNGRLLAFANLDQAITLAEVNTHCTRAARLAPIVPRERGAAIKAMAISPDGRFVATSASAEGTARLWDAQTGEPRGILDASPQRAATSFAFSSCGEWLAAMCPPGIIRVWHTGTGSAHSEYRSNLRDFIYTEVVFGPTPPPAPAAAVLPHGQRRRLLAAACSDGAVGFWDADTATACGTLLPGSPTSYSSLSTLAFSPDGRLFAAASSHYVIQLWDVATLLAAIAASAAPLPPPPPAAWRSLRAPGASEVQALTFSPDGALLAAACSGGVADLRSKGTIQLWHAASQQLRRCITLGDDAFIGRLRQQLSFAADHHHRQPLQHNSHLHSDDGALYLETDAGQVFVPASVLTPPPPQQQQQQHISGHDGAALRPSAAAAAALRLAIRDGRCITYGARRLLWLPDDYRLPRDFSHGERVRFCGDTVAVSAPWSVRPLVVSFDLSKLPFGADEASVAAAQRPD